MKKKIIALTVLVVLVVSVALTGCTFVKVNNERKANEIMATVSLEHEGQTLSLNVTRNELISYVNYIINLYSQYGMNFDAEELIKQGLDSLINQKYLVLQGMVYLSGIDARKEVMYATTDDYKAVYGTKLTPEGVLTVAERYAAIKSTNESFIKNIDTYIEDYEKEKNELALTNAKEELASLQQNGYSVKENGVAVYHKDEEGNYHEGLYQTSFIGDNKVDYKQVILQITLVKDGDEKVVYLPATESAVSTEDKEDAEFISNYVTAKVCKVTYDEPQVDEKGETTYKKHTGETDFTLVTPRTAYTGEEEEEKEDLENGSVKFRYATFDQFVNAADDSELAEIYKDGQIFQSSLASYASDAEKDAYRQFRENKKNMNINFEATKDDCYSGLGYYYLSSFENAVLSAVQHELKKTALKDSPISDLSIIEQYKVLVEKQKEEYSVLTAKEQIQKFATTVKSNLTSAYYVPIDALKSADEEFEYNDAKYTYAVENNDGTVTINMFYIGHILFKWTDEVKNAMEKFIIDRDEDETKEIKTQFLDILKTNKSKLEYATAEEEGKTLADAFFVVEGENGEQIAEFSVKEVIAELKTAMEASENPLETFQEYMTYFNDDSGSMSSKLGYFVPMGDIDHGYDGDDFPNMAIDLYLKYLAEEINPAEGKTVSEFAFTSYGLHIEYITFAPFYHITLDEFGGLGYDTALDLDGSTFAETIREQLESQVASNAYSEWTNKYGSEEASDHAQKDDGKMKSLLKDLGVN